MIDHRSVADEQPRMLTAKIIGRTNDNTRKNCAALDNLEHETRSCPLRKEFAVSRTARRADRAKGIAAAFHPLSSFVRAANSSFSVTFATPSTDDQPRAFTWWLERSMRRMNASVLSGGSVGGMAAGRRKALHEAATESVPESLRLANSDQNFTLLLQPIRAGVRWKNR